MWGGAVVEPAICIVPSRLSRAQDRLRLGPTRVAVPMRLRDLFRERGRKPCPRKAVLVERLGLGARQVRRKIADQELPGPRQARRASGRAWGKLTDMRDLCGPAVPLRTLEPEIREAGRAARTARRAASRQEGRRNRTEGATKPS